MKPASNLTLVIILIILTLITYANILPNQLFFDDEELIYKNSYVQNIRNFPKYFTSNMIAGAEKISNMYRPVLTLSFAIDYFIWQGNPFGFHLTSIILHAVNSILIFFLIYKLFGNKFISFLTAVLFIIHPVQSEAVAYASGRTDPLSTLFILTSLLLFLRGNYSYIGSLLFFILAILSKETAIILPLLLLLTITFLPKVKINFKKIFLLLFPFLVIDFIYIALRLTALNFADTLTFYNQLTLSPQLTLYSQNVFVRFYTFTKVFFDYLAMLIFPRDLIIARNAEIITSLANPWVLGFLVLVVISTLAAIKTRSKNKFFLFALLWFFTTIIPVSGIIPINNIIAEHYLYLPSVSFFLLTAYFINWLFQKTSSFETRSVLVMILFISFSLLTIRTIIRTFDWRDPITFYTKSLQQSPENIPMRHNLAMTYADNGQLDLAISQYKQVISLADVYPNTHHNLGNAYMKLEKYKDAEKEYLTAIKMDPNFYFSYYALADLYQRTGEKEKLEEVIKKLRK